jgi:hypothetical protein
VSRRPDGFYRKRCGCPVIFVAGQVVTENLCAVCDGRPLSRMRLRLIPDEEFDRAIPDHIEATNPPHVANKDDDGIPF